MEETVKKITKSVLNTLPHKVESIHGRGKNNQIFKVFVDNTILILRLHNSEEQLELYKKEEWCAETAAKAGVLTPRITNVGFSNGYSYSFQEYIDGTYGKEADQKKVWFALGQYAKSFHKIPAKTIALNYKQKLQELFADNLFTSNKIFSTELSEQIQIRLQETLLWDFEPLLCHGNLHPSNVIADKNDQVWLLDWETATGNRVPYADLAEIYTWNNRKENIAEFCRAYGLSADEMDFMMRDIQTLVLLRLVDVIKTKIDKDNDWKQSTYIQETTKKLEEIPNYQEDVLFTKNL